MALKYSAFCEKYNIVAQAARWKHLFKFTHKEGYVRPWIEETKHNLAIVNEILAEKRNVYDPTRQNVVSMADFCRRHQLPQHRFSRWKHRFQLIQVGKYKSGWVIINEHNNRVAQELLATYGTRPKKARLTFAQYQHKYGISMTRLSEVFHRLDLEEKNGQMFIADTKKNYALLTTGRPFLK